VYTLSLFGLLACLPKYLGNQCLEKGKCDPFSVIEEHPASQAPFEISRDDIAFETRVGNFQLTDRALLAQTEVRETCRALHMASRTYAFTLKKWYHKPFKNYRLVQDSLVNGEYEPCSEWGIDTDVELSSVYTNTDGKSILIPIQKSNAYFQFPFVALGWGMLENPLKPTVTVKRTDTQAPSTIDVLLPERNADWLCEAIPTIDRIVAKDHYSTWKIILNVGNSKVALPYLQDEKARLILVKEAITGCSTKNQQYLQGIIKAAANDNPKNYGHLNYLHTELFNKKLTGISRAAQQRTGTSTTKKSPQSSSRSIVGTYQCNHNGSMAYMRIYRNGVFSLKLELQSGSAQGVCTSGRCTIESINGNAANFTGGVNKFSVKRTGNALIMNKSVRCTKKS
jgi:hypothetical protein